MNTSKHPIQIKFPSLFLIHGRDHDSRDAIATLVRSLGIEVITWSEAITSLPFNKHDVWSVVRQGFSLAHGAIVILSPDEISWLQSEFRNPKDGSVERGPRFQPRPNVLIELGYALYEWEDRTMQIVIGSTKLPSDRDGKWTLTISGGDPEKEPNAFRNQFSVMIRSLFSSLANKGILEFDLEQFLKRIKSEREHWMTAGDIEGLSVRESKRLIPSFIEAGVEVKQTRFRYRDFFSTGNEFILTGTNFGDQMGDRGTSPGPLHEVIINTIKQNKDATVYIVLAPYELLEQMIPNSIADLKGRSAGRLKLLQNDPRLTVNERKRLHIFDHRGATFLSIALRFSGGIDNDKGLVVVTPRWFKDEAGPQRMFFAIEQSINPEVFKAFIAPIYPSIKVDEVSLRTRGDSTLGGRTIDEICSELGVEEDPYLVSMQAQFTKYT